jgi:hypothetical protein
MPLKRTTLLLFLILGTSTTAFAHGQAEWIQQDPGYGWCCGPHDCERAPVGAVVLRGGNYFIPSTNQSFAFPGGPGEYIYPSIDLNYWWCRYPDGRVRCLFVPPLSW